VRFGPGFAILLFEDTAPLFAEGAVGSGACGVAEIEAAHEFHAGLREGADEDSEDCPQLWFSQHGGLFVGGKFGYVLQDFLVQAMDGHTFIVFYLPPHAIATDEAGNVAVGLGVFGGFPVFADLVDKTALAPG
jgi:hypothetical protein